jgi:hypothetical protein
MVMIAICSSLIGAVLARGKVLALFPAILLGLASSSQWLPSRGHPHHRPLVLGRLAIGLQLGYFGGLLTRYCLTASR